MLATCFTGRRDAMATEKTSFLLDEEAGSINTAIAAAAVVPTLIAQTANDDDDVFVRDRFLDNANKAIIDKAELEEESVRDTDGSGQKTMHGDEEEANLKGENQTAEEAEQDMAEEQKTDAAAAIKVEKTDQEKEDAEEMSEALRVEGDQATLEQQQRDAVHNGELKVVKEPGAASYQNDKKRVQGLVQERQKKQCRRGGGHATNIDERKKDEEDVCYICFDGGDLVMCDRRYVSSCCCCCCCCLLTSVVAVCQQFCLQ
jgi:hypothetical protein